MTLELYSAVLSIGLFIVFGIIAGAFLLYFTVPSVRRHILSHGYERYLAAIGLISFASILGALLYQIGYLTPVCELCWWQRIFLFPIAVVAFVALWFKSREAHITSAILAGSGLFYAVYHYYYHFQGLVLGNKLSLPCSSGGLLPACTDSPILTFGFITIPFMGILVFSSILMLAFFAHKKAKAV
jgi:disulfide bond formation protein DsbB